MRDGSLTTVAIPLHHGAEWIEVVVGNLERLAGAGIDAWPGGAALLRTTLARDLETWTRIIREANITAA